MKMAIRTRELVLFIMIGVSFLILSALVHAQKKPAWKGKVEVEDGVKVIKNPEKPLYGEIKLDLVEDLQIGNENDDNYIFGQIIDIEIDDEGSIYVADLRLARIQKYDKNGCFLQTIGKKGRGPGEYEAPWGILFHRPSNCLYVRDWMNVKKYDKDGKYISQWSLRNSLTKFSVDGDGDIWGVLRIFGGQLDTMHTFEKLGQDGKTFIEIASFPYHRYVKRGAGGSFATITTGYEFDLRFRKVDDSTFWYGYSNKYELNAVNKEGKLLFKIEKEEKKDPITAEERREQGVPDLPEYKPYFYDLATDDMGRIYVFKSNFHATEEKVKFYDIYSKDGYFLYKAFHPYAHIFIIRNGYLYARDKIKDEEVEVVKRFKIKNWNSLPKLAEGLR
jgi:hypothetical protein